LETCKRLVPALGLGWKEVCERAFTARLKSWLKREGYPGLSEADLVEIIARVKSVKRVKPFLPKAKSKKFWTESGCRSEILSSNNRPP
jgi:hypothetical protein